METANRKRKMYESFLEEVPLLVSLEPYERHKIADALESVSFEDGEVVIRQGDSGDSFYIIESGEARVVKVRAAAEPKARRGGGGCGWAGVRKGVTGADTDPDPFCDRWTTKASNTNSRGSPRATTLAVSVFPFHSRPISFSSPFDLTRGCVAHRTRAAYQQTPRRLDHRQR